LAPAGKEGSASLFPTVSVDHHRSHKFSSPKHRFTHNPLPTPNLAFIVHTLRTTFSAFNFCCENPSTAKEAGGLNGVPELRDPLLITNTRARAKRSSVFTLHTESSIFTMRHTPHCSHSSHHNFLQGKMNGSSSTMRSSSFGGATLPSISTLSSSSPSPSPTSDRGASSSRTSSPHPSSSVSSSLHPQQQQQQQQQQQHPPLHDIEDPTENDVLSGRGVTTNKHPGNVNFRSLVSLNKVSKVIPIFSLDVVSGAALHFFM
jgi:hypothetical protein